MARPTKLTKELVEKAEKYLSEFDLGGLYHGELPMRASFALYLGIHRETVIEWAALKTPLGKRFSDIVRDIDTTQEYRLIGNSLKNTYNAVISKLLLSSNHGYTDKQAIDHTTDGEKIALVEFVGHDNTPDGKDTSTG